MKKKLSVHDLCYIGVFTAIISVVSQLSIPMPYGVPMTLQTFIIPLAGIVLGPKNGTIASLIYILLGAIGIPVFAGYNGGLGSIFGPTGGFIISFPLMALLAGIGAKNSKHSELIIGLILGTIINFAFGAIFYSFVTANSLYMAFIACVLPFIPTAIIKIILIDVLGLKIKSSVLKGNLYV